MKPKPYIVDGPAPSVATTARRLGISKHERDEIHKLVRTSMEPKTMTRVYAMGEEWFGANRFTVWISNAGRTRHIAVRVKRGVMVEGVGPTWLDAFQDAARLQKAQSRRSERASSSNRFDCRSCGNGVLVDNDGCCRTCGLTAIAIVNDKPALNRAAAIRTAKEVAKEVGMSTNSCESCGHPKNDVIHELGHPFVAPSLFPPAKRTR